MSTLSHVPPTLERVSELRQCIDFEQAIPHLDRSSASKRSRIHRFDLISVSLNVILGLCMETVSARSLTSSHKLSFVLMQGLSGTAMRFPACNVHDNVLLYNRSILLYVPSICLS